LGIRTANSLKEGQKVLLLGSLMYLMSSREP